MRDDHHQGNVGQDLRDLNGSLFNLETWVAHVISTLACIGRKHITTHATFYTYSFRSISILSHNNYTQ